MTEFLVQDVSTLQRRLALTFGQESWPRFVASTLTETDGIRGGCQVSKAQARGGRALVADCADLQLACNGTVKQANVKEFDCAVGFEDAGNT